MDSRPDISTEGGTHIGGDVSTGGGDSTGRDANTRNVTENNIYNSNDVIFHFVQLSIRISSIEEKVDELSARAANADLVRNIIFVMLVIVVFLALRRGW